MVKLVLTGRTDLQDYFGISGVFDGLKLTHTPFLVFKTSEEQVRVEIVDTVAQLLHFPDDTQVMGQWRGEWKSDFFQFTVGDYRSFADKENEPYKTASEIVKVIGPQGGLRSLSFTYIDNKGQKTYKATMNKDEAARLEAFFFKHNIVVQIDRIAKK